MAFLVNIRQSAAFLILSVGLLIPKLQADPAYFISIDGLQPALLQTLNAEGKLTAPRGFSWLLGQSLVADRALPVITTITAPSHISSVTCSPPSRHGVIANEFLQGGASVNGFLASPASEPLWRTAMRQGKKVLALAYVGSDGSTAERTADYGLAYPDPELMGPSQAPLWNFADLPRAEGWTLPEKSEAKPGERREAQLSLVLNPKTGEKRSLHLLIESSPQGSTVDYHLWISTSKNLREGLLAELSSKTPTVDLFLTETAADSPTAGARRRTILRLLPSSGPTQLALQLSKSSYNQAYPISFRRLLDEQNLVWPDYSVKGLNLSLGQAVEAQATIDRFLTKVATQLVPKLDVDLVFFYQPLLDTVGHDAQSALPLPFQPNASDEVTQAFVKAFQIIDQNLSDLLAASNDKTPIVLMGDHGMDAVQRRVNVSRLLLPSQQKKVRLLTSGQLLMLYRAEGASQSEADAVGVALRKQLKLLRDPDGQPVLGEAHRRSHAVFRSMTDYRKEWQYGDAEWAFMGTSGNWLHDGPKYRQLFLDPKARGMHGAALSVPSMATTLIVHGAGIAPERIAETSLIHAAPTLAQLIGIKPPRDCLGQSLIKNRSHF